MTDQNTIELRWIFSVIRNWLWLILGCALLAGLAAWIVTTNMDPKYQATATLYVKPSKDSMSSDYSALIAAERLALTYSELLTGRPILEQVIAELGLEVTSERLASQIDVKPIRDTQLIQLSVEDSSPQRAAQIANQLAITFAGDISSMAFEGYASQIDEYQSQITVLDERIKAGQNQIDLLQAKIISEANQLDRLQTALAENRNDARVAEGDLQDIQLAIAQVMGTIKVFEPAELPGYASRADYTATVLLLISPELAAGGADYSSILASERLSETYAQMIVARSVLAEAIERLGLTISASRLEQQASAEPIANTQLIELNVRDDDVARATDLANTIATVFVSQTQAALVEPFITRQENITSQINALEAAEAAILEEIETASEAKVQAEIQASRLETTLAEDLNARQDLNQDLAALQQLSNDATEAVYITETATIPAAPASNHLLYIGLAILVGGMIGAGCAFLIEYLDDTIKTSEDVARLLGVSMLGTIGRFTNQQGQLIVLSEPHSPVAEAFRVLASNIKFAAMDEPIKSLIVTSPSAREGKSAVLANLAVTLARTEASVVAIDADLRLPTLHKLFGIKQSEGLTGALLSGNLSGKLQNGALKELKVLTSGDLPPDPTEVISSARMQKLLRELKQYVGLVVVDCPPILPVADAAILASMADGAILVVRANQTRVRAAREALQRLQKTGTKLVGVVLNDLPLKANGYYGYAYTQNERAKQRKIPKLFGKLAGFVNAKVRKS